MKISVTNLALAVAVLLPSLDAFSVSQWTRKYKTNCQTCHTQFPRLNYYGEKFMRNGYQDPDADEADGGTLGKKTYGNVDIGRLEDIFGVRINFSPISYESKGLEFNGKKKGKFSVGDPTWIQFFTAGTITKNISFFDEFEVSATDKEVHHGWFKLGFHNIANSNGLVNIQVGKISPSDFTAYSNRLRILPEYTGKVDKITTSEGKGEEPSSTTGGQFAAQYYGYKGPMTWALGVGNGSTGSKDSKNKNEDLNSWVALRYFTPEDNAFEGSALSFLYYMGTDSKDTKTQQIKNKFVRLQPAFNIRFMDFDVMLQYQMTEEDNYALSATAKKEKYNGYGLIVSYLWDSWIHLAAQYDKVNYDSSDIDKQKGVETAVGHVGFLVKENVNLILTHEQEMKKKGDDQNNKTYMTVRSMF